MTIRLSYANISKPLLQSHELTTIAELYYFTVEPWLSRSIGIYIYIYFFSAINATQSKNLIRKSHFTDIGRVLTSLKCRFAVPNHLSGSGPLVLAHTSPVILS